MKSEIISQINSAVEAVAEKIKTTSITHVYFVACGGSQALMMPAQYMLDREISIPAGVYNSNEFNYGTPKDLDENSIVITCSHSGNTPETVEAARMAKEKGAISIALSNLEGSPLWEAAGYPIHYEHGPEIPMENRNKAVLYGLVFNLLKVIAPEQTDKWEKGLAAIDFLQTAVDKALVQYKDFAVDWGKKNKREKIIYTMASGADYGEMYSLAICLFMEMQWINSSCIHSGEYFHGPFEITDYDVPFIISLSNGATRYLDERAYAFCKKYSNNIALIDENTFDMTGIAPEVQEYYGPLVTGAVTRAMVDSIAFERGHSLAVRRYMWQMEY